MRRADFWTLYCPEFPLRKAPRITVRGHSVQNDSVPLRKAPLPSRIVPWSTRRPCGPLAFRRATEGSRVQRRVWGSQEGAREPYGALAPFCPSPWARRSPAAGRRQCTAMSWRISPGPGGSVSPAAASRRNGGTAHPLLRVKTTAHRRIGGRSALC